MNENEWVLTYCTTIDVSLIDYAHVCDILEKRLLENLKKYYQEIEHIDDQRDGETLSVRFKLGSKPNPPNNLNIEYNKDYYNFEKLELEPMQVIYPDYLHELFIEYLNMLNDNLVPFSYLSIDLLIQALESYRNGIYDGTVILCRSIIDSSLILAIMYKKNINEDGMQEFHLDEPETFKDNKNLNWDYITNHAKNILYKDEINKDGKVCKLENINKNVRELGNFAAHIGERQIKESYRRREENKEKIKEIVCKILKGGKLTKDDRLREYKLSTSVNEANFALNKTIKFLIDLVNKYSNLYP
jgi:hypothetical protein